MPTENKYDKYLGLVTIATLLLAWWLATDVFNLVRPVMFPSPSQVIDAARRTSSLILVDVLTTSGRVLAGLASGVVLGVGVGMAMCFNRKLYALLEPIVESIRPVPVIAMIPFFLMWFGVGEIGKYLLVVLGVFAIMVVNTIEAVRNLPKIYTLAGQTLGASSGQLYRRVVFPGIVPALIGPLRVSAAISFTLVVAAEFMGANAGMGFRILEARRLFNTDVIFLGVIMFGLLSTLLDFVLRSVLSAATRWADRG